MLRLAEGVILNLIIITSPFLPIILLRVTPTANRNSYRVARLVGVLTQGSVLRPQPWAEESQLLQSCRCLRSVPKKPLSGSLQRERIEPISQTFTMGCEFILVVFEEVMAHTFPSRKTGVGLYFATAVTLSAGSYLMIRELVPYDT